MKRPRPAVAEILAREARKPLERRLARELVELDRRADLCGEALDLVEIIRAKLRATPRGQRSLVRAELDVAISARIRAVSRMAGAEYRVKLTRAELDRLE